MKFSRLSVVALAALPVLSFAASDVDSAISGAQTEVLGYIATWGAAFIAIALSSVGWKVGGKLIKKLTGAA